MQLRIFCRLVQAIVIFSAFFKYNPVEFDTFKKQNKWKKTKCLLKNKFILA